MIAVDNDILKEAFLEAVMDDRPSIALASYYSGPITIGYRVATVPVLLLHVFEDRIEIKMGNIYNSDWKSNEVITEIVSSAVVDLDIHMETNTQILEPLKRSLKDIDDDFELFKDWYMYEIGNDIKKFPTSPNDKSIINVNRKFTINEIIDIVLEAIFDTLNSYY